MSVAQWRAYVDAIDATHGTDARAPAYRAFVQVHVDAMSMSGMDWSVHSMGGMAPARNFLAWHRYLLVAFEQRLQLEDATISLPYWDWIADPGIPVGLSDPADLAGWSVRRDARAEFMPTAADYISAIADPIFVSFQSGLENSIHNAVHNAVGGTMASASSPADPLFWSHHANIDRIWNQWQSSHPDQNPPNADEVLQPAPLFDVAVSTQTDIGILGYRYE